jgi:hypothetical protein
MMLTRRNSSCGNLPSRKIRNIPVTFYENKFSFFILCCNSYTCPVEIKGLKLDLLSVRKKYLVNIQVNPVSAETRF